MKPYKHHDPVMDQGKAEPKPKRACNQSPRPFKAWNTYPPGTREKTATGCCLRGHEPNLPKGQIK